jgi:HD-like signal output (HDOD) protein
MTVAASVQPEKIVNKALAGIGEITTLPEIIAKIIQLVEDPKSTARDLHQIIKHDPTLSARILKVVNSAFYGLPGQIATVDRAIIMLGLSTVKNIAIAASITKVFRGSKLGGKFTARDLWIHSLAVATACRMIVKKAGWQWYEDAFLGGLIHDLGLLVERQAFGESLAEVIALAETGKHFCQAEVETIGITHQQLGQGLTTKWKFPRNLRAVTGYHHDPERASEDTRLLTSIVHVADRLSCQQKHGFYLSADGEPIPDNALEGINISAEQVKEISQELPEQLALSQSLFNTA